MPHKTLEARRAYAKKWAAAHPGYGAESSRKTRLRHPNAAREEYLKHKAAYVARAKAWQKANPEKTKASKRKSGITWRQKYPERQKASHQRWIGRNKDRLQRYYEEYKPRKRVLKQRWREANRDKISAQIKRRTLSGKTAEQDHRRRARMLQNGYENCSPKVKLLRLMPLCSYCFGLTSSPTIDHVIPITRGGEHRPHNLVASCKKCNLSKGNKLITEWVPNELKEVA